MSQSMGSAKGGAQRPHDALALDLNEHSVALMAREPGGTWACVGRVSLNCPDFVARIDDLRVEARVRGHERSPVSLWLPPEQILRRELTLRSKGPDALHEARKQIAAETPYEPADLMIAIGPSRPGNNASTTVLAALSQSVSEASEYARKWGFRPGPVSTRVADDVFCEAPPIFRSPTPVHMRVMRWAAPMGLAACVGIGLVFGIAHYGHWTSPLMEPVGKPAERDPVFAFVGLADHVPDGAPSPLDPVGVGAVQTLAIQRLHPDGAETYAILASTRLTPAHRNLMPGLRPPSTPTTMQVGPAPDLPARTRPSKLAAHTVIQPRRPLQLHLEEAAPSPVRLADPVAITAAEDGTLPKIAPEPRPVLKPAAEAKAATVLALAPNQFAPARLKTQPRPRPRPWVSSEPSAPATTQTRPATVEPGASANLEPTAENIESETPTVFAALMAPPPPARPRSFEMSTPVRKLVARRPSSTAPQSVRTAAAQRGLLMSETNLIGVLQGNGDRQAILRLEDGKFMRVRRGDDVRGWRVSTIGRDTLRLTRQGRNRTLLLVSR